MENKFTFTEIKLEMIIQSLKVSISLNIASFHHIHDKHYI